MVDFDESNELEGLTSWSCTPKSNPITVTGLNKVQQKQFCSLIKQFEDVFADSLTDLKQTCELRKFEIITLDEMPIFKKRRISSFLCRL
jgi:hypothetical protein